jgi:flagellar biosynthesis/type III secretory pathway protein FliH
MDDETKAPARKIIPREEFAEQGMDMASVKELRHMMESAEERANALYEEAKAEGYAKGQQEGRREFLRVCADAVEAVRSQLFQLEDALVPTVLLAVERVFGQFEDVELIRRVLRAALKELGYAVGVTIRVSPDHTEAMKVAIKQLIKEDETVAKAISGVEGDPSLKPDEILLETIQGRVHVGIPYQIARLKTGLGVKA